MTIRMIATKIEDLFTEGNRLASRTKETEHCSAISEKLPILGNESVTSKFEKDVLNYLYVNRKRLGIEKVYPIGNMLIDGALMLKDGLVLLEFKYALNWHNSCNARVQIQRFMEEELFENIDAGQRPKRALIVFDHFSSDWDDKAKCREDKNGWYFFYEDENAFRKNNSILPIDIAQLTEKGLCAFK